MKLDRTAPSSVEPNPPGSVQLVEVVFLNDAEVQPPEGDLGLGRGVAQMP